MICLSLPPDPVLAPSNAPPRMDVRFRPGHADRMMEPRLPGLDRECRGRKLVSQADRLGGLARPVTPENPPGTNLSACNRYLLRTQIGHRRVPRRGSALQYSACLERGGASCRCERASGTEPQAIALEVAGSQHMIPDEWWTGASISNKISDDILYHLLK